MKKFTLIEVASVGKATSVAMVGGQLREVTMPVYPDHPLGLELRRLRVDMDPYMGLRELAARLGLRAVDLSGLEFGRATLTPPEWQDMFDEIRRMKRGG